MSGFEVVGVVLGVIPLLVEGLKAYQHGLATASHMIKYEKAVTELVLRFTVASSLYVHTCERLVRPLMLDPIEWSNLIDNPGGVAWRDEEFGAQIRERLGSDYEMYTRVAKQLHGRLILFADNLDLDSQNGLKPKWLAAQPAVQPGLRQKFFQKSNQTWKGLKVGFKNGSLEDALQRIEADLDRLGKLLDANECEAPTRRERKRHGAAKIWQSIREAAQNIHEALSAHWQCSPDHQHVASLRLETRNMTDQETSIRFGLILSLEDPYLHNSQFLWHDVEIEPEQKPSASQSQTTVSITKSSIAEKYKVSFALNSPTVTVTQTQTQNFTYRPSISNLQISNLCHWQRHHIVERDDCLGFLEHRLWHHYIYHKEKRYSKPKDLCLLSLRDCVTSDSPQSIASTVFARGLSTKEKYHIATVLASSVLQLAHTPWLSDTALGLEEIFLVNLSQRALTATSPYIRKDFPDQHQSTRNPPYQSTPLIENELVFALGVILIEFAFQQPLSSFKQSCDVDAQGDDHPYTNLQIATRLVKDLHSMEGKKYADAARRCVKCSFDVSDYSLENVEFQEQFYTGVVLPLQELKAELD